MKEILLDLTAIGCGLALLAVFVSIKVSGGYMAVENTPAILWAEIALALGIVILGIERLIDDFK